MSKTQDKHGDSAVQHFTPELGPQVGDARQISYVSSVVGALLLIAVLVFLSLSGD